MFPPHIPFSTPACWEWNEGDEIPEGLEFIKGEPSGPSMHIKICLLQLTPPRISVEKTNIKEIHVDIKSLFKWGLKRIAELPEYREKIGKPPEDFAREKCEEFVRYAKMACNRIDFDVTSDIKEEKICFTLPTEWRFRGVLKNNAPIPFEIIDTNKVCFTITHESPTLITLQLISDTEQMTSTITSLTTTTIVLVIVITIIGEIIRIMRLKRG